jgi:uncharacterized protein YaaW (UPF0174 family)
MDDLNQVVLCVRSHQQTQTHNHGPQANNSHTTNRRSFLVVVGPVVQQIFEVFSSSSRAALAFGV